MKNQSRVELRVLGALHDTLILKSVDKRLLQASHRLNRKLFSLSNELLQLAFTDPSFDPRIVATFDDRIRAIYDEHLRQTYRAGEQSILTSSPALRTQVSVIPDWKLDNLIKDKVFQASTRTIERLTGTVYPKIQEGIKSGASLERTTKALQSEFRDMLKHEVRRIARTETHTVYNDSKMQTMNGSDKIKGKQWLSSGLENMRPEHAAADGQTVHTDEPFLVGGEELMYPGDPAGSAGNIINCACTMIPIIREDQIP